MTSQDLVRIARQRAGLTQQQLADRSGHSRETIARWETGAREPSLSTLRELVGASNLDLVIHLSNRDPSLVQAAGDQLERPPARRLDRILSSDERDQAIRALRWLEKARTPAIVIGDIAAALQGGPQRPASSDVEFVAADPWAMSLEMNQSEELTAQDSDDRWTDRDTRAAWALTDGGRLVLRSSVPGTGDYRDLRRNARPVQLYANTSVTVAHPRDLVRMADAATREGERARLPGLQALLELVGD